MKIIFFGCTAYSEHLLNTLMLLPEVEISAIFSSPEKFSISYSKEKVKNTNYADLSGYAKKLGCDYFEVDSEQGKKIQDYAETIKKINADVILVLGWYYMIPKSIRTLAKHGAWGIHASLLPNYAGGAPLVWAMIKGEKKTGVTLFRLDDGVDDGDIILQKGFDIDELDSIAEVYQKATLASEEILSEAMKHSEKLEFKPQEKSKLEIFPQRKPSDGEIDLGMPAKEMYDFIRAQSSPYPGAFIKTTDGKKIVIEKARIE